VSNGLVDLTAIVDVELTLRGLAESSGEDFVSQPADSASLDSLMCYCLLSNSVRTGVEHTELLVLASSGKLATVVVPVNSLDDVSVTLRGLGALSLLNIPELDGEVSG